jgi:hypothetical protein
VWPRITPPSASNTGFTRLVSDGNRSLAIAWRHPDDKGEDMKASASAISLTLAVTAAVSGCALDPAIQQRATAFAIGGTAVAPEQVRISNPSAAVEASVVVHRWHASVLDGEYECSGVQSEQLLVQPVCVKK